MVSSLNVDISSDLLLEAVMALLIFGMETCVYIRDGSQKKRLKVLPSYPTSISSLSFSKDGTFLAIAASYTFEEGEKE
jgi:hypothetical protein